MGVLGLKKLGHVEDLGSRASKTLGSPGGGQRAESRVNSVKRQLRRTNMLGRSSTRRAHLDHIGLSHVVSAVASYRKAIQDTLPPKKAWEDDSWLGV